MHIEYGSVRLDLVDTNEISREAIYSEDGRDYLWTKWRFNVSCVVNRDATAYRVREGAEVAKLGLDISQRPAVRGPINPLDPTVPAETVTAPLPGATLPVVPATASPVTTDWPLRRLLMTPRQPLIVWEYAYLPEAPSRYVPSVIVAAPRWGEACDVDGGPRPIAFNIQKSLGENTWLANFQIECCVNECQDWKLTSQPAVSPFLSCRWTMRHTLDADYFCVREVWGQAVFRQDVIERMKTNPDAYRANMFLGIPSGFKREGIEVTLGAAGNVVNFRYIDRQLGASFINNIGATRFELVAEEAIVRDVDILTGAIQTARAVWDQRASRRWAREEPGQQDGAPIFARGATPPAP